MKLLYCMYQPASSDEYLEAYINIEYIASLTEEINKSVTIRTSDGHSFPRVVGKLDDIIQRILDIEKEDL